MDSWFSIFAGGALMEVNDLGSLAVGQRLRLKVDFTEPQVLLHIVEQELPLEGEAARLLRQRLPVEDQNSLAGLQALLEAGAALDESAPAPVWTEKLKLFLANLINDKEGMTPETLAAARARRRVALRDETASRGGGYKR